MTDPEDRRPGAEPDPSPRTEPDPSPVTNPDRSPAREADAKPDAATSADTPDPAPPVDFGSQAIDRAARIDRDPVVVADPAGTDDDEFEDDELEDNEFDDDYAEGDDAFIPRRWVSLVTTLGLALIAVVGAQVLASIVEGFSLREGEPNNIPNDFLHRLGSAFPRETITTLLVLLLALVLLALPAILDEDTTETQEFWVNVAYVAIIVLAVIMALGSGLRVRYELHFVQTTQTQGVPRFFRIQLVSFLLGMLGAAAAAVWGSMAAMRLRDR